MLDHGDEVWHLQFSHDGTLLASACKDGSAAIWEISGPRRRLVKRHTLKGHIGAVVLVAWSPDDSLLATCGVPCCRTALRPMSDESSRPIMDVTDPCNMPSTNQMHEEFCTVCSPPLNRSTLPWPSLLCFWNVIRIGFALASVLGSSAHNTWPAAGSDATLRLWDPVAGSCSRIIRAHASEVTAVVWWPDGQSLITGSHDSHLVRPFQPLCAYIDAPELQSEQPWRCKGQ